MTKGLVMRRAPLAAIMVCGLAVSLLAGAGITVAQTAATSPIGLQQDVSFTDYTPLSSNAELARRMLTPLTAAKIPELLARTGKALSAQAINLTQEKFVVYAPPTAPPNGYGLLVFVPPWPDARLPADWTPVLDRYGVIFVSAARSGNDASPLGRREPLALLAAQNIMHRYKVDPDHVFIGGFSGGSRVAMRLALAYPDLFHGAILNAGSDPIGGAEIPLPPRDLMLQAQTSTRLVYISGDRDAGALDMDAGSMESMRRWCVFGVSADVTSAGHELARSSALARALQTLLTPARADANKLAACRNAVDREVSAGLDRVKALQRSGDTAGARKALAGVDARFGGLAAPQSVELSR